MSFRERPEYQAWRDAVFQLYRRKCIFCGHDGNITAHHVMAVNTYPELAFEPTNGVPLCGNCHTKVNGNEEAYVEECRRRQQAILKDESYFVESDAEREGEEELRQRAESDPSDADAVGEWFSKSRDPQAVVDFFQSHHSIPTTARIYNGLSERLEELGCWDVVVRVIDAAGVETGTQLVICPKAS